MQQNKSDSQDKQTQLSAAVISQVQQPTSQVFSHQQVTTIFDPEILRKYSEIVPDAPNRVLAVFEQNSEAERRLREESLRQHQSEIDLQKYAVNCQAVDNRRRDWMVFVIIIADIVVSAVFAALGTLKRMAIGCHSGGDRRICRDRIPAEEQKSQGVTGGSATLVQHALESNQIEL